MKITAAQVKELRQRTGVGMMDCKKALKETEGDVEAAVEYLQKKGMAKASKKAGRVAAEGRVAVAVSDDATSAVMIEVNCETDFVARNSDFTAFVDSLAAAALAGGFSDLAAFTASSLEGKTVEEVIKEKIFSIGENINLRRLVKVEGGALGYYIHNGAQVGVVMGVDLDGASTETATEFCRDIAMHVAASNPEYVAIDDIDPAAREKMKEIEVAKAMESGKPANIAEKMVVGRIKKWEKEICLLEQEYVKDPDFKVKGYQDKVGGLKIASMTRFDVGAGIEKKTSNLAEEVAALQS